MTESSPRMLLVASSEARATLLSRAAWAAPRLAASTASSESPPHSVEQRHGCGAIVAGFAKVELQRPHAGSACQQSGPVERLRRGRERTGYVRQALFAVRWCRSQERALQQRVDFRVPSDGLAHLLFIGRHGADTERSEALATTRVRGDGRAEGPQSLIAQPDVPMFLLASRHTGNRSPQEPAGGLPPPDRPLGLAPASSRRSRAGRRPAHVTPKGDRSAPPCSERALCRPDPFLQLRRFSGPICGLPRPR